MSLAEGTLAIDFETQSALPIDVGSPAYAEHPSTRVHCVCGAWWRGGAITDRWSWVPGQELPAQAVAHIAAGRAVAAHNAGFESSILRYHLHPKHRWPTVRHQQWIDTAELAGLHALPAKLEGIAAVLGSPIQKDMEGHALMLKLCKAGVVPTPEQLQRLIAYCHTDVDATLHVLARIPRASYTATERAVMAVDRKINAIGIPVDREFAATMARFAQRRQRQLNARVAEVSDYELLNVTRSAAGLKDELTNLGLPVDKLPIETVHELLARSNLRDDVRALLECRAEGSSSTSLKKLDRVAEMVNSDGRIRQMLRYANAHTGRWSSGGLQVHNLPRTRKAEGYDADALRFAIETEDYDAAVLASTNLLRGLSWQLRSVVRAPEGYEIIGGDYSAIEARVVAWLAGQSDVLQLFADGDAAVRATGKRTPDIYVEDAKKIPSDDRQLGKVARLGCGFGMSAWTFVGQAAKAGIELDLKQAFTIVSSWRKSNPKIVALWRDLDDAVHESLQQMGAARVVGRCTVTFNGKALRIQLPSGRSLHYWKPTTAFRERKLRTVTPEGTVKFKVAQMRELHYWEENKARNGMAPTSTYGGKLTENITQAVARDLLAEALLRLDATEYVVFLHVHDSIAALVPAGTGDLDEFAALTSELPVWAKGPAAWDKGLPNFVEAYRSNRFKG